MTRAGVTITTVALLVLFPTCACAQEALFGGAFALGSGLEAGDAGRGVTNFRRARTRILAGVDMRSDELPRHGLGVYGFAELEPHSGFGGEVRYMGWLSKSFVGFVGFSTLFAPHTLYGGVVGAELHFPMPKLGISVFVEPSVSVMPFGTDLPTDRTLLWTLLTVGVRADLSALFRNEQ